MTVRITIEADTWDEMKEKLLEIGGPDYSRTPITGTVESIAIDGKEFPVQPMEVPPEGIPLNDPPATPPAPTDSGLFVPTPTVTNHEPPDPPLEPWPDGTPPATEPTDSGLLVPPPADVDSRGIPWDARVHAGNKATTKAGEWKRRRGVDVAEVKRVEAELTAATPPAPPADAPPPSPPPTAAAGTEPPPATYADVLASAKGLGMDMAGLNALTEQVTNGEITQLVLALNKPAYIQAVYDALNA